MIAKPNDLPTSDLVKAPKTYKIIMNKRPTIIKESAP